MVKDLLRSFWCRVCIFPAGAVELPEDSMCASAFIANSMVWGCCRLLYLLFLSRFRRIVANPTIAKCQIPYKTAVAKYAGLLAVNVVVHERTRIGGGVRRGNGGRRRQEHNTLPSGNPIQSPDRQVSQEQETQ